jgi:hypothetical protein
MPMDAILSFQEQIQQDASLRERLRHIREEWRARTLNRADARREIVKLAAAAGFEFSAEEYEAHARQVNAARGELKESELE